MIVHNFNPVLIDLGLFEIRWYSIAYILGIIIGWVYAGKIIKETAKNKYDFEAIKKSDFDDLLIYLVVGIILGVLIGNLTSSFIGGVFVIPWLWIFSGISLCIMVGIVAGIFPALQAAKLDPIEALRYE